MTPPGYAAPVPPPASTTRRRRRLALVAALLLLLFLFFGCNSTVTPPPPPADPTSVFLLRDALHIGVVLPDPAHAPHRYIEFGFGDWGYYALGNNAWYHTFATVLWSTPGALSRREFVAADPAQLRRAASWVELDEVSVERAGAEALRARLETEFAARAGEVVHQPRFRMDFVPAAQGYWFGNTCADVAAGWLTELGCTVSWAPIRGGLAVAR